jgi:hypothetical protein
MYLLNINYDNTIKILLFEFVYIILFPQNSIYIKAFFSNK